MIRVRISHRPLRLVCFDLESRPLAYWFDGRTTSEVTAFGWKWLDESDVQTMVLRADGRYECDDGRRITYRKAHERFGAVLASAGRVYGHNIRKFDLPMLAAWRIRLGLPPFEAMMTTDTLRDLPRKSEFSASLESMGEMYGIDVEKPRMPIPKWEKANQLRPDGVAAARNRVTYDVLLQEALRKRLIEEGVLREAREWKP